MLYNGDSVPAWKLHCASTSLFWRTCWMLSAAERVLVFLAVEIFHFKTCYVCKLCQAHTHYWNCLVVTFLGFGAILFPLTRVWVARFSLTREIAVVEHDSRLSLNHGNQMFERSLTMEIFLITYKTNRFHFSLFLFIQNLPPCRYFTLNIAVLEEHTQKTKIMPKQWHLEFFFHLCHHFCDIDICMMLLLHAV